MNRSIHFIGSLIGHGALLALAVVMAGSRGCTHTYPEAMGGGGGGEFTMVDLVGDAAPATPPQAEPEPPPRVPTPPEPPPKVPDADSIKLPDATPEKPKPVKKPDPVKTPPPKPPETKKPEVKKPETKKPEPVKKPAEPKVDLAAELRKRLGQPTLTPSGKNFTKVGPGTTAGPGRGDGVGAGFGNGPADGSLAVAKVLDELDRKLYAAWEQPRGASSFLSTEVYLRIAPSGVISEFRVSRGSGDAEMDSSVLAAVREARAVSALPRELRNGYETRYVFRVQH